MTRAKRFARSELTGAAADEVAERAWRKLEQAADDPSDPLRIVTLCTVTPEGTAAGRLMLLRGVAPETGRLWCHTARHDAKVADLRANPSFAAVAYDPLARIQIRITGSAKVHELDATTVQHFEQTLFAKKSGQVPSAAQPDPIWPTALELLIDEAKRDAWKEFVVLELCVQAIDWTEVSERSVSHALVTTGSPARS